MPTIIGKPNSQWWTLPGARADFDVCDTCHAGHVQPRWLGPFMVRVADQGQVCDLCPSGGRSTAYLARLDEAFDTNDWSRFETFVRRMSPLPVCPGGELVAGREWYGYPGIPVCPECWVGYASTTSLGAGGSKQFKSGPARCSLSAPTLRALWEFACSASDPQAGLPLLQAAAHQHQQERTPVTPMHTQNDAMHIFHAEYAKRMAEIRNSWANAAFAGQGSGAGFTPFGGNSVGLPLQTNCTNPYLNMQTNHTSQAHSTLDTLNTLNDTYQLLSSNSSSVGGGGGGGGGFDFASLVAQQSSGGGFDAASLIAQQSSAGCSGIFSSLVAPSSIAGALGGLDPTGITSSFGGGIGGIGALAGMVAPSGQSDGGDSGAMDALNVALAAMGLGG